MKEIFDSDIGISGDLGSFSYNLNFEKYNYIKSHILGKTVIFTNRDDWSNEQIVSAYRSQFYVKSWFDQMNDYNALPFLKITHSSDSNITVHSFCNLLSLTLSCLFNLEFFMLGYNLRIDSMLSILSECQQVINFYIKDKQVVNTYSLFKMSDIAKKYFNKYYMYKYALSNNIGDNNS
jgi:hypothetical protein